MPALIVLFGLIAEFFVSLKFVTILGFWWSVVWIFSTALVGVLLIKYSHYKLIYEVKNLFGSSSLHRLYQNSMGYIIGAGLLILPGLITDILGCFALAFAIYLQFVGKIQPNNDSKGEKDVIDVEVIDDSSDKHSNP